MAFITIKNNPKVIIVIGNVSTISIGFTVNRNNANTTATSIDVVNPSTETPGSIFAITSTAIVVSMILKIDFIIIDSNANKIPKKNAPK